MNILHILSSDDKYGSAQCFLELLEREQKRADVTSFVVTPRRNEINRRCDVLNVKNYVVDYEQYQIPMHDGFLTFLIKYLYHGVLYWKKRDKAVGSIIHIAKENQINVIHTNSCVIDLGSIAAKRLGISNVWHLREFGKQDFHFFSVDPFYISKMNGKQNEFIAISNVVARAWIDRGLKEQQVKILYDGINAKRFPNRMDRDDDPKIRFVMCGSFCDAKNQKLLVEAIHLVGKEESRRISVDFYGNPQGKYFHETEQLVNSYGLNDVISFKGYSDNVPAMLSQYDVGVICSRAEAFGRVTVEYMMASLCTVATQSGANPEIIEKGCGVLFETDNSNDLAEVIHNIIKGEINIKKIGLSARQVANEKYDINMNARKIINYFVKMADK